MRPLALAALALLSLHLSAAMAAPDDWIAREKIRAGWIYHTDGADKLAFFKQQGLNALITHASKTTEGFESFRLWAREAHRAQMHLFGVVSASYDVGDSGLRRCVFGNGYESVLPCPLEERYWNEVLTPLAVNLAKEGRKPDQEVSGALIDWEMYANSGKGGQIYYTDACYCDSCFGGFLKSKSRSEAPASVPPQRRADWLQEHGLAGDYQTYLQARVRALATGMREAVAAVDPGFFLGFYPVPHNWHLKAVAQGLGTPEHPMILWATTTYGGGGPEAIAETWRQDLQAEGIHCYYSGGLLLRFYSALNLARNVFGIAAKTDGYWLFTVHTLCLRPEEQSGDYYLCAGSPEEYLAAIRLANQELDRYCRDRAYHSELELLPEPVRYRHPGFDVNRFRPPELRDTSTAPRGAALPLPPLGLNVGSFLMMSLQAGQQAELHFAVDKARSGQVWGVSYSVLGPGKELLGQGQMPPGEEFSLRFGAAAAGLHTVVLSAGYYGRCTLLTTTVPYALWTGDRFEVARPGGKLHFVVPPGLEQFDLGCNCLANTAQVQLTVTAPDGQVVLQQATDPYVRSLKLKVPVAGRAGQWTLEVSPVSGKSFSNVAVQFDKALPQAVTVRPDFRFEGR